MHGYWTAGRGSGTSWADFGPFDASAGRVCRAIDAPAGPGFMHQLRPDRGQLIHQLGARAALSGPFPVDRWARIAANCAPQLRHASRIAGRWAVGLGQNARAAGGLDLREIE